MLNTTSKTSTLFDERFYARFPAATAAAAGVGKRIVKLNRFLRNGSNPSDETAAERRTSTATQRTTNDQ